MQTSYSFTTKKKRDSNMELLRIVAMFLVLIDHCNFASLGAVSSEEIACDMTSSFCRLLVETLSITCVNIFVLISGWYGIKPKLSRAGEFIFQVFFIMLIALCMNIFFLGHLFCLNDIKDLTLLNDIMWFPKAYFLLYILSPVLNAFIENGDEKLLRNTLLIFYIFQFAYGWLCGGVGWFNGGFSTISFIGLYMLARYCRLYLSQYVNKISINTYVALYILTGLIVSIVWMLLIKNDVKQENLNRWFLTYNSPHIILEAILLLLAFNKIKISNCIINWVASSCFAVYIFHCSPGIGTRLFEMVKTFYQNDTLTFVVYTGIGIFIVFTFSILIDKIRLFVWNNISKMIIK